MIRSIDEFAPGAQVRTDVLVVGGGAAGITLALELEGSGLDVTLLEAGGLEHSDVSAARYEGELDLEPGLEYPELDRWRLRFLGGTTNHWTGWCRPIEHNVFDDRSWISDVRWPVTREELTEPYDRAHELCELGRPEYDAETIAAEAGFDLAFGETDRFTNVVWRMSPPTRFGMRYADALEAASASVVLGANVVAIEVSGRRATGVVVADDAGVARTWLADRVVLASGGLENCRHLLLMASQGQTDLDRSGWLGRGFMEHPHAFAAFGYADALPAHDDGDATLVAPSASGLTDTDGTSLVMGLGVRQEYATERAIANVSFTMHDVGDELVDSMEHAAAVRELRQLARTPDARTVALFCRAEQRCRRASSVDLTDATDDLGVRRLRLRWRLDQSDLDDIVSALGVVAGELATQGLGPLRVSETIRSDRSITGGAHHLGGARMSDDPDRGVVDRNGRAHALDNLYVCGGAVFPASGFANPTLTVVALAVRLAAHLRS